MDGTLIFDIETHSSDLLFTLPPEEFVRLIGYKWADSEEVHLTTDLDEIQEKILSARFVIGHNIHSFDLPAVFGVESDVPLELAMEKRVYDTWTHAVLVNPAPYQYVNRFGKTRLAAKPEQMKSWFALDEQAFQLGVQGKTHDLKALAKEYGKAAYPDLLPSEQTNLGFGLIDVSDQRYRDYLVGDVRASEAVAKALLKRGPLNDYAMREQEVEARKTVIRANGLRVDIPKATARRDKLEARKQAVMSELEENYGLPTEGDMPWRSDVGKQAILDALADRGVTPERYLHWPKTDKGNLSLGGKALEELTRGTEAEDLGAALAEVMGQRPLSQQALDCLHPDGFVHPEITMLQRSGRWSTTEPGLTTWTNNGPGAIEKDYFIADNDDEVLIEFDFNNADARGVAAVSGDEKYAERFEPGADGHMINALAAWGEVEVSKDPKGYRKKAKPLGHGWNYGGGAGKPEKPGGLVKASGLPYKEVKTFCEGMAKVFVRLVAWQNRVRKEAKMTGYVVNHWGRRMKVERGREYTQSPALIGQSITCELIKDALLRMPIPTLRRIKCQIHDALLASVPHDEVEWWCEHITGLMEARFHPEGGMEIDFPVSSGPAGKSWYEAIH